MDRTKKIGDQPTTPESRQTTGRSVPPRVIQNRSLFVFRPLVTTVSVVVQVLSLNPEVTVIEVRGDELGLWIQSVFLFSHDSSVQVLSAGVNEVNKYLEVIHGCTRFVYPDGQDWLLTSL